jgi:hypothetical protein
MKNRPKYGKYFQQRFTLLMALLFCLFVSSVEYIPQDTNSVLSEQSAENPDQTFLSVAVDAVVPFVVNVSQTVLYLIYQVFNFELRLPTYQAVSAFYPNQLIEILFERIISTKGP